MRPQSKEPRKRPHSRLPGDRVDPRLAEHRPVGVHGPVLRFERRRRLGCDAHLAPLRPRQDRGVALVAARIVELGEPAVQASDLLRLEPRQR